MYSGVFGGGALTSSDRCDCRVDLRLLLGLLVEYTLQTLGLITTLQKPVLGLSNKIESLKVVYTF